MQYAPPISSNIGNILATAGANSSQTYMQGMEALGDGIKSAAGSIAGGMTKSRENAMKYDAAAGMMDTYKENATALGLDMQMLDGLEQKYAKDPDKLIGALTVVGKMSDHNLDVEKAEKTYAALGNAYLGKAQAAADVKAAQPPKMNPETIRAYAHDASTQGATPDQIKAGLMKGFGQWAVDAVFPQPKQNFWGP